MRGRRGSVDLILRLRNSSVCVGMNRPGDYGKSCVTEVVRSSVSEEKRGTRVVRTREDTLNCTLQGRWVLRVRLRQPRNRHKGDSEL